MSGELFEHTDGETTYAYTRNGTSPEYKAIVAQVAYLARQLRSRGEIAQNQYVVLYGLHYAELARAIPSRVSSGNGRAKRINLDRNEVPTPNAAADRQLERILGAEVVSNEALQLGKIGVLRPHLLSDDEIKTLCQTPQLLQDTHLSLEIPIKCWSPVFGDTVRKTIKLLKACQFGLPVFENDFFYSPVMIRKLLQKVKCLKVWTRRNHGELLNSLEFSEAPEWRSLKPNQLHILMYSNAFFRDNELTFNDHVDRFLSVMKKLNTKFVFTFLKDKTRLNNMELLPPEHPLWHKVLSAGATISQAFENERMPETFMTPPDPKTVTYVTKMREHYKNVLTIMSNVAIRNNQAFGELPHDIIDTFVEMLVHNKVYPQ